MYWRRRGRARDHKEAFFEFVIKDRVALFPDLVQLLDQSLSAGDCLRRVGLQLLGQLGCDSLGLSPLVSGAMYCEITAPSTQMPAAMKHRGSRSQAVH